MRTSESPDRETDMQLKDKEDEDEVVEEKEDEASREASVGAWR